MGVCVTVGGGRGDSGHDGRLRDLVLKIMKTTIWSPSWELVMS